MVRGGVSALAERQEHHCASSEGRFSLPLYYVARNTSYVYLYVHAHSVKEGDDASARKEASHKTHSVLSQREFASREPTVSMQDVHRKVKGKHKGHAEAHRRDRRHRVDRDKRPQIRCGTESVLNKFDCTHLHCLVRREISCHCGSEQPCDVTVARS